MSKKKMCFDEDKNRDITLNACISVVYNVFEVEDYEYF
jgi:hypothetical protein